MKNKKLTLWGNKPLWVLIFILLGTMLTWVRPVVLEEGGEITYLSMLIVYLAGYVIGWREGFLAAFFVGLFRFGMEYHIMKPETMVSDAIYVPEVIDIVIAYTLLAFGGLLVHLMRKYHWHLEKYALQIGFLFGAALKFAEAVWNCYYFYDRPGETVTQKVIYAFVYCGGYIGTEVIVSFILLMLPPVIKAVNFLRLVANVKYREQYDMF